MKSMSRLRRKLGYKITFTGISVTMPRKGSADSVLSWCEGCTSDTLLGLLKSKSWLWEQAVKENQLVDGKKLIIRRPYATKNTTGCGGGGD